MDNWIIMNDNVGNLPTGGTAREGEGTEHEEMATETTAGTTGDLEFISGMLQGVDVSMTREVRTHGYPTRQQQGRRNRPESHADGRRGRRKISRIKNQDVEGPSHCDTSTISDDSWNQPSSKSNLRFFHCKACDVWIPRGEKVWQTHVSGIRHRRQALSIRHTGSRNSIILSAFERDMPKDVLLEGSRRKKTRHSEDDRRLKKSKSMNIVEHHMSFLSRARISLSAQVLNMFGRDASRMYHSAVACFTNSAFSKVYGHAESFNVTIGSCPGALPQRMEDFHEFAEEWAETTEPIDIYFSVCTPAGVVRIVDILLQETPSKKDHNLAENIFLDFGTGTSIRPLTTLVDIIHHRKYSLHVKIHRSTRGDIERNLDSGHAAAYFAALIFFLDEIYSSEYNSVEQIKNLRRLSFEFPQLVLPLGDASFKQGTRHMLRAARRVLGKNVFVQNITLKLLERSSTRRQTIDWIDGLRDTINPEIQHLAQKRQESCQIALLMGWHRRLGQHSPLQLLPRNIVQLIFDLVFKESMMNLLLLV